MGTMVIATTWARIVTFKSWFNSTKIIYLSHTKLNKLRVNLLTRHSMPSAMVNEYDFQAIGSIILLIGFLLKLPLHFVAQLNGIKLTLLTKEIGVCQSSEDWSVLLLLHNINIMPRL